MRLEHYLTEGFPVGKHGILNVEEAVERIKKDCKPFLQEFKRPLYRGSKDTKFAFYEKTRRTDRHPRNMPKLAHETLDRVFNEVFGWKAR